MWLSAISAGFNTAWFSDIVGNVELMPTRDDVFDMLRTNNADALSNLFASYGQNPANDATLEKATGTSEAETSDAMRTLQVAPSDRVAVANVGMDVIPLLSGNNSLDTFVATVGVEFQRRIRMPSMAGELYGTDHSDPRHDADQTSSITSNETDIHVVPGEGGQADLAARLALLRQDLAAFGGQKHVDELEERCDAAYVPLDYFA